ncbi:MAG TPA: head GIN domain-containing protein [Gaiellaceae bacterium]|jgi:Putative auto-transporter adhesin, head GIN domain
MNDGLRKLAMGIAALALLALLTACEIQIGPGPKGSGVETSAKREVASFNRVDLRGDADVSIVAGEARSVTVRGDDNLLGRVKTKVEGDTLVISTRRYRSKIGMTVEIGVPALNGVELSGSGTIDVHKLSGASFSADLSGSGELELDGKVDALDLDISGSGDARLDDVSASDTKLRVSGSGDINASGTTKSLEVNIPGSGSAHLDRLSALEAQVDISGDGDVALRATTFLKASISGSGDISYAGNPRRLIKKVSGDGTISAR